MKLSDRYGFVSDEVTAQTDTYIMRLIYQVLMDIIKKINIFKGISVTFTRIFSHRIKLRKFNSV